MSLALVVCIILGISFSANAVDVEPPRSRFKYYTVYDPPEYQHYRTVNITAGQSQDIRFIEPILFNSIPYIPMLFGFNKSEVAQVLSSAAKDIITENNLDRAAAGTYDFYQMKKITYKEHMETKQTYVDREELLVRVDVTIGGK